MPTTDATPTPATPRVEPLRVFLSFLPVVAMGVLIVSGFFRCPSLSVFGMPCPGCGLTRATLAAAHFDFATMWRMHPLAPIVTPIFVWALVRAALSTSGLIAHDKWRFSLPSWAAGGLVVLILGVWLARAAGALGGLPDAPDFEHSFVGAMLHLRRAAH